jgi:hypothetical protein
LGLATVSYNSSAEGSRALTPLQYSKVIKRTDHGWGKVQTHWQHKLTAVEDLTMNGEWHKKVLCFCWP